MLISKMSLFCLYDLSFHQYVHIITLEGPCLKAHISVTDCSILNLKRYSESTNQSLLIISEYFSIVLSVKNKIETESAIEISYIVMNATCY